MSRTKRVLRKLNTSTYLYKNIAAPVQMTGYVRTRIEQQLYWVTVGKFGLVMKKKCISDSSVVVSRPSQQALTHFGKYTARSNVNFSVLLNSWMQSKLTFVSISVLFWGKRSRTLILNNTPNAVSLIPTHLESAWYTRMCVSIVTFWSDYIPKGRSNRQRLFSTLSFFGHTSF